MAAVQAPECTEEVHKNMERRSEDVRFNYPLAHACREDRARVCPDLNPVCCNPVYVPLYD